MNKIMGHVFLSKLGKKRLRPGGVKATNWLKKQTNLNNKNILEVGCNKGTTSFELARKYNSIITAVDKDLFALEQAKNSKKNKYKNLTFSPGNAFKLEFSNETFDVIFNEAMLTMLNQNSKITALKEYNRVLKDNGVLLNHDICLLTNDIQLQKQIIKEMSETINTSVEPKTVDEWLFLLESNGFGQIKYTCGKMTLLTPRGLIKDEGIVNTFKIIRNAFKKENKVQFKTMRNVFKKYKKHLGFIAIASFKQKI
ncbi:class I SAM-dependent methyltransferase [Spiroplasma chinense]|uniref:Class I SAM-dependent methyltransferase n=1 Tax=Spiroplasma chinense TaxID=216932 RepID=A0A5B9Y4C1_9MOLU|nr:class I SAM-dependent methyltransferase [Spiroplasma chinense]QEH61529.1 class I SAM-dependent methyltransferase [Spiroplasma chinense]